MKVLLIYLFKIVHSETLKQEVLHHISVVRNMYNSMFVCVKPIGFPRQAPPAGVARVLPVPPSHLQPSPSRLHSHCPALQLEWKRRAVRATRPASSVAPPARS